ncbi:TPA: hypothetical protein EYP44_01755 [Candidatus Bathyarchaeota archaeon]|nr:hypothetical protein [Candidatus Bathyarchaeota archaeon]
MRFLGSTFYAYQYGLGGIKETVNAILDFLTEEGMLRARGSRLYATRLGRRVSELYIDPVSAVTIRDGLERGAKRLTDFSFLHMVCRTPDLSRRPHPSRKEVDDIRLYIDEHADEFMFEAPDEWVDRVSYGEVLREVKAAMVLEAWINEVTEAAILERFNVEPGDLYYLTETANWLLYATREIADLLGHKDLLSRISTLKDRVKHGVKEEIAPLARLRGIGRVRARMLYNSGFRTMADLRRASLERLASVPLIGMRTARGIKEQVGGLIEEGEWKRARRERDQKRISEFIS